jgi:hypothetical protein
MKRNDDIHQLLSGLSVPPARTAHRDAIIAHARANPRAQIKWLARLRELRAYLYVPQMRYAIMGSVVGCFILIGLFASPAHKQMTAKPLKKSELLADITFSEEEWTNNFWSNDPI